MLQGRTGRKTSHSRGQDNKQPASVAVTEHLHSSYTSTASTSAMYADYPLYATGTSLNSLSVSISLCFSVCVCVHVFSTVKLLCYVLKIIYRVA